MKIEKENRKPNDNLNHLKTSLFANPASYSSKLVPLQEVVRMTQYDNILRERTDQFRKMMSAMGKKSANKSIKEKLVPAFSVAVTFKGLGHSCEQAQQWTGMAMCDIDHVEDPAELEATFNRLTQCPQVLMMYHTISGTGLRIIYKYVREDGEKIDDTSWRAAFLYGNERLSLVAGHAFDTACSDYTRLSGMAHDDHLWVNADAEPFAIPADMIVEENCEYQEHGKSRKVYMPNAHHAEVSQAWQRIQQMMTTKGFHWESGCHHDYVLHAAYLFNRFGVEMDQVLQWAQQEWADYDAEERERAIRHQYKATDRFGTWKLNLPEKGRDNGMMTLPEIRQWLNERITVTYNQVTDQMLWRCKKLDADGKQTDSWKLVDNMLYNTLRGMMAQKTGKRILTADVKSVIESDFAQMMHPIREYIKQLPEWDGHDRVAELATRVHVEATPAYFSQEEAQVAFHQSLHKWLVGMVATWMSDDHANEQVLTLIGPQGIYKTTFFRSILPPQLAGYHWENNHNSFHSKDDKIALSENCLVEIEEIEAIEGRDLSEIKGLVTSHYIKERRPYAVFRERKPRLASFCASGNKQRILTDKSGSRRWLCYLVSDIDDPHEWNLDYEQIYAQLYHEYQNGFRYYLTKDEERKLERQNRYFQQVSPEEELIACRLRKPRGNESAKLMNATMIATLLCGGVNRGLSVRKIGEAMRAMKYSSKMKDGYEYYRVVEIPYDQQQYYIEQTAENGSVETIETQDDLPF